MRSPNVFILRRSFHRFLCPKNAGSEVTRGEPLASSVTTVFEAQIWFRSYTPAPVKNEGGAGPCRCRQRTGFQRSFNPPQFKTYIHQHQQGDQQRVLVQRRSAAAGQVVHRSQDDRDRKRLITITASRPDTAIKEEAISASAASEKPASGHEESQRCRAATIMPARSQAQRPTSRPRASVASNRGRCGR